MNVIFHNGMISGCLASGAIYKSIGKMLKFRGLPQLPTQEKIKELLKQEGSSEIEIFRIVNDRNKKKRWLIVIVT